MIGSQSRGHAASKSAGLSLVWIPPHDVPCCVRKKADSSARRCCSPFPKTARLAAWSCTERPVRGSRMLPPGPTYPALRPCETLSKQEGGIRKQEAACVQELGSGTHIPLTLREPRVLWSLDAEPSVAVDDCERGGDSKARSIGTCKALRRAAVATAREARLRPNGSQVGLLSPAHGPWVGCD